jgi:cytochrome c oxidase subunit 3
MIAVQESDYEFDTKRVNPKKFALWLLIIAMVMLFAGLTSAYIVRMGEGNWYKFYIAHSSLLQVVLQCGGLINQLRMMK